MKEKRVKLLEEAVNFLDALPTKDADKIYYNIRKVLRNEGGQELFKKLTGTNIWEFRTLYNGNAYRLFAFWDIEEDALIIATHGLIKKTQKTSLKEIERAEALRIEYINRKK